MRLALALLALVLAAGPAAAGVALSDVDVPRRTLAGHAWPASVRVTNEDPEGRVVYLFAALYAPEAGRGPCGPSTDPRFRAFTPLLQARLELAPRESVAYPPEGEAWLQRYDAEDVPAQPARLQWCVFAAEDAQPNSAQLRYHDFEAVDLATRTTNARPVADFQWDPSIVEETRDTRFVASGGDADGDEVSYAWDFGHFNASGRAVARGSEVVHFFYPAGDYDVTLVASDGFEETRVTKRVSVLAEGETPGGAAPPPATRTPLPLVVTLGAAALAALRPRRP